EEEEGLWAWLGGRRPLDPEETQCLIASRWPAGFFLAAGEPGSGIGGWRLPHRQARAGLPVAVRGAGPRVRDAHVALLSSVPQDELLSTSLREIYLKPLEGPRGAEVLRETLRAYFAANGNVSSAAAALGVSRQAVTRRLRAVEVRLGRSLGI